MSVETDTEYEVERRDHYRKRFNKEAMCDIAARRDGDIRRLERELAEARAECARLRAAANKLCKCQHRIRHGYRACAFHAAYDALGEQHD